MIFGCQKLLGQITKVLGMRRPPPLCWEKFPNNSVFFFWCLPLKWRTSEEKTSLKMNIFLTRFRLFLKRWLPLVEISLIRSYNNVFLSFFNAHIFWTESLSEVIWRTLRSGIHFSAKVERNWKWSNGVRKDEIELFDVHLSQIM